MALHRNLNILTPSQVHDQDLVVDHLVSNLPNIPIGFKFQLFANVLEGYLALYNI